MYHKRPKQTSLYLGLMAIGLLVLTIALAARPALAGVLSQSAYQRLQTAWQRASAIGQYDYHSNILQTTIPVTTLSNVGRGPQTQRIRIDGTLDKADDTMQMDLQIGHQPPLALKITDGHTYGRRGASEEWTELEQTPDFFAPGGDPLGFLAAMENVRALSPGEKGMEDFSAPAELLDVAYGDQTGITRYAFTLSGPKFARFMKEQMESELRRKGELPPSISLSTASQYMEMTGHGEIWVNAKGLPVRQLIHVDLPEGANTNGQMAADLVTTFDNWADVSDNVWTQLWHDPAQLFTQPTTMTGISAQQMQQIGFSLGMTMLILGLAALAVTYRQRWGVRATVYGIIILSMMVTPLLQTQRVSAFYDGQQARVQEATAATVESAETSAFNPHKNPVQVAMANSADQSKTLEMADATVATALTAANAAQIPAECTVTESSDCDGDGLSDQIEIYQIGTLVNAVDTDGDGISDKTEIQPFTVGGQTWYLDPRNIDSNGDGLPDSAECSNRVDFALGQYLDPDVSYAACGDTDGDGTPDVYDFDNDGDGVPDSVDSAPNVAQTVANGRFGFALKGYESDRSLYVDLVIRPTNDRHLWWANNVLDWPANDVDGQIQRRTSDTLEGGGDMRLTPLLEVSIPYDAANPTRGLPLQDGVAANTVGKNTALENWLDRERLNAYHIVVSGPRADGLLYLYAPLHVIQDEVGDTPVAFGATLLYEMAGNASGWGSDHEMRLLWTVNGLNDHCDAPAGLSTKEVSAYCAIDDNWTSEQSIFQSYYDDFVVTGLAVEEHHGAAGMIVAQNAAGAAYERDLWHLADTLQDTYLEAQQVNGQRLPLTAIESHLSAWGINAGDLYIKTFSGLHDKTALADALSGDEVITALTQSHSGAGSGTIANLLFVGEETAANATLASTAVTFSNNAFTVDLTNISAVTTGAVRWNPYHYALATTTEVVTDPDTGVSETVATEAEQWAEQDVTTYAAQLQSALAAVLTKDALVTAGLATAGEDATLVSDGAARLATNYYLTQYVGAYSTLDNELLDETRDPLVDSDHPQPAEPVVTVVTRLVTQLQQTFAQRSLANLAIETNAQADESAVQLVANTTWKKLAAAPGAILAGVGALTAGDTSSSATIALATVTGPPVVTEGLTGSDRFVEAALDFTRQDFLAAWAEVSATGAIEAARFAYSLTKYFRFQQAKHVIDVWDDAARLAQFTGNKQLWDTAQLEAQASVREVRGYVGNVTFWAAVGLAVELTVIGAFFAYTVITQHLEPGSPEFNQALAMAYAQAIVAVMTFVLIAAFATIPGVNLLLAAILFLDALASIVCEAAGVQQAKTSDWGYWVCGGLTGALTKGIALAVNDTTLLTDVAREDHLDISFEEPGLTVNGNAGGMAVGNTLHLTASITTTAYAGHPTWMGYSYPWQLDDDNVKEGAIDVRLQNSKDDFEDSLSLGGANWQRPDNYSFDTLPPHDGPRFVQTFQRTGDFTLDEAGVNQGPDLYLSEAVKVKQQDCWLYVGPPLFYPIPICQTESNFDDTFHQNLGDYLIIDVFPGSLDEFHALAPDADGEPGIRLAWDETFPVLRDADNDGLTSKAFNGPDPDDSNPDTDADGLSDFYEIQNGFDPTSADADCDGLTDYWEAFYNTDPARRDSDNDGLLDSREIFHPNLRYPYENSALSNTTTPACAAEQGLTAGYAGGWEIVYTFDGDTPLHFWVSADPNNPDSDDDGLSDKQEQVYGYSPLAPSELDVLALETSVSMSSGLDTYVRLNDSISYEATVTNDLNNKYLRGLLETELPVDSVISTREIDILRPFASDTLVGTVALADVGITASTATSMTLRAGVNVDEPDDHLLWLRLNDVAGSTTLIDSSLNNNDATATNVTTNGSSAYLPVNATIETAAVALPAGIDGLTLGVRFQLTELDPSKNQVLLGSKLVDGGYASSPNILISGGHLVAATLPGFTGAVVSGESISLNEWHHAAATFSGSETVLYLDGNLVGSGAGVSLPSEPQLFYSAGDSPFYVDDIEIFSTVLDGSTMRNHYGRERMKYALSPNNSAVSCSGARCPTFSAEGATFDQTQNLTIDTTGLAFSNNQFTIALNIAPEQRTHPFDSAAAAHYGIDAGQDWQGVYGYEDPTNPNRIFPTLYVGSNGALRVKLGDGSKSCSYTTPNGIVEFGVDQQVAVSFDGSTFTFFVDGVERASGSPATCSGVQVPAVNQIYVGRPNHYGYFYWERAFFNYLSDSGGTAELCLTFDDNSTAGAIWHDYNIDVSSQAKSTDLPVPLNVYKRLTDEGNHWFRFHEDDASTDSCNYNANAGSFSDDEFVYREGLSNASGLGKFSTTFDNAGDRGTLYWSLSNEFFAGTLRDLNVYDYALSAEGAKRLYNTETFALQMDFDEAPGETLFVDNSGNYFEADCAGNACPDSGIPGRWNQALRFDGGVADDDAPNGLPDGVADILSLHVTDTELGIADHNFTIMAWVKPDRVDGVRRVLAASRTRSNNGVGFGIWDGSLLLSTLGAQEELHSTQSTVPVDQWSHVAVSFNSNNEARFYVNGAFVETVTASVTPVVNSDDPYLIGATTARSSTQKTNVFDGLIDDLRVLRFAADEGTIRSMMNEAPLLNLHLDEDINTTRFADDSLNGYDGSCADRWASDIDPCPDAGDKGQIRESASFDGEDDVLTASGSENLNLDTYTIALWVKPRQKRNFQQPLITNESSQTRRRTFGLYIEPNSMQVSHSLSPDGCTSNLSSRTSLGALLMNQWNHVVMTFDGAQHVLYINGSLDGAETYLGTPCQVANIPIYIGGIPNYRHFAGNLDEVTVEEGAMTEAQVQALYAYQSAWYDEKQQHTVLVDADAPIVSVTLADNGLVEPGQVLFIDVEDPTVNGVASGLAGVQYSIDGGAFTDAVVDNDAYLIPSTATAGLGEGNHTVQVRATDNIGLSTTAAAQTVRVDTTAPTVSVSGQSGTVQDVRLGIVKVVGQAADAGAVQSGLDRDSVQTVLRDRQGNQVGAAEAGIFGSATAGPNEWRATHELTTLPYGEYTVEVTAKDEAGNEAANSRTLLLDGLPGYGDMLINSNIITGADTVIRGVASDIPYPESGRTLHMHFEEGADDTFYYDGSQNHLNATCSGSACPGDEEFGQEDSAVFFGGSDYLVIGDITGGDQANGEPATISTAEVLGLNDDFTILSWVRPGSFNGIQRILAAERANSDNGVAFGYNGNKLILSAFGVQDYTSTQPTGLALGEWSHVAASYDATTNDVTFYVNGELLETVAGDADLLPNLDDAMRIGAGTPNGSSNVGQGLNGALDELVVYSKNLSAEEIYDIANPLPNYTSNVKVRYRHAGGAVWPQLNPDGVALYLPFDEPFASDSFQDLSLHNAKAICNEATNCPETSFIDPAKSFESGRYLTLDGVDDYLVVPNVLDPATTDFTASLWFSAAKLGRERQLLQQANGSGNNGRTWLSVRADGTVRTFLGGSALDHPAKVSTLSWHHAAVTYEQASQTLTLYVDGVPVSTTRAMESSDGKMLIGVHKAFGDSFFSGYLDEVVIFDRALSASEIGYLQAETWHTASPQYDPTDGSDKLREWSHQVPAGLEGPYKIDLLVGEGSTFGRKGVNLGVWTGEIDTLAPRVDFTYTLNADGQTATVTCTATDYNLSEDGWQCPVDNANRTSQYIDAAWFTTIFTATDKLVGLSTVGDVATATATLTMSACDLFGHCRSTGDSGDTPVADNDADNVPDAIEDGAPNGGDGNGDGTPDSQQANVTSLPDASGTAGEYVTLAAPGGAELAAVRIQANAPAPAPTGVSFPIGHLDFSVQNVPVGGATTVTLFVQNATRFNTYYKYGATPDDGSDHWYEFLYDGSTGAEFFADRIVLHFVDGGRGDADLTANGVIVDPGAPALFLSATDLPYSIFLPLVGREAQVQAQAVESSAVEEPAPPVQEANPGMQPVMYNATEVNTATTADESGDAPQPVELTHQLFLPLVASSD
ncbi:MAG: LamG-like jellyroll fold domain-containing protein [Caldilineaceae bacterium]